MTLIKMIITRDPCSRAAAASSQRFNEAGDMLTACWKRGTRHLRRLRGGGHRSVVIGDKNGFDFWKQY